MGTASAYGTGEFTTPLETVLAKLENVKRNGHGWTARCPGHEDRHNSFTVSEGDDGRALLRCHAGCDTERIVAALGLEMRDLFPDSSRGGGGGYPPTQRCNTATPPGCTLAAYAAGKRLPLDKLRAFGLSDIYYDGAPAVRIPYRDAAGRDAAVRFRTHLAKAADGDGRFRWKSGAKPCLYGRDRLPLARDRGYVALLEGESDCHTLWCAGEPAVGLPGATNWRDDRDAPELDGIPAVYVVIEPDTGGQAVKTWLATSRIRERAKLVDLSPFGVKDPSALYLAAPDRFQQRWQEALTAAVPWTAKAEAEAKAATADAWAACEQLARKPDILVEVADTLAAAGVAGEERTLKLVYLIVVSRFLPRPVSAAIKGPSSGGKSYTLERVLRLFPADAYYALSAMSERALAYDEEPLAHRHLVLYEAAGLAGDFASYLVRSLLSEGHVRYVTVEKTKDGLKPRLIERDGPTGLLVTTTAVHLHPENETRMLSLPVTDTPDQTRAILRALAAGETAELDPAPWHALQRWLAGAEHAVTIPYALALSDLVPPAAVRLRRDFGTLLALLRAHAILHQATRERDEHGRIVATVDDYAAVRALVADLIAEGVGATVPAGVRETVAAVRALREQTKCESATPVLREVRANAEATVSVTAIAMHLGLDKSAASRRVRVAVDAGYLKNLEDKKGRPAKIALGDPLPDDLSILPAPGAVAERCSVAGATGGKPTPLPPRIQPANRCPTTR